MFSSYFLSFLFFSFLKFFFFFPSAKYIRKSKGSLSKKRKLAIALVSIAVPMFLVFLLAYIWLTKKKKTKGK